MTATVTRTQVFLFIPNVIDYIRLLLIIIACTQLSKPVSFIVIYCVSALLDGLDGYMARKLNQVSDLGVFLDVMIDIISRGFLWCLISEFGYFIPAIEWIVYISNSTVSNNLNWKDSFNKAPTFVKMVMANGFKTPLGMLVIIGLHGLPVAIYICQHPELHFMSIEIIYFIMAVTFIGRLICLAVESWCIFNYFKYLADQTASKS